ncbi:MAG: hypothetical protein K2Q07_05530 [Burkholderiaceae bacterium]|nr:hypothetical protein [Burkholderiaceae bacterium]
MFNTFKAGLLVIASAAVLLPGVSAGSMLSGSGTTFDEKARAYVSVETPRLAGLGVGSPDFLSWLVGQPSGIAAPPRISLNLNVNQALPVFVPSVGGTRPPFENLRGSADLSLWNLVAAVHAQQRGNSFKLVEASVTSLALSQPDSSPLSTVPLPPAMWLFVMGALGMAGVRVTGLTHHKRTPKARAPDLMRAFGGAVPT